MKILLDPGHGGDQPGAVYGGGNEKDITLAVCLRCANTLRRLGHDALLTRDRDETLPLQMRLRMIDEYKADAFLSVHCNADASGHAHGLETYYRDDRDYPLANLVHKTATAYTGRTVIGLFQDEARLGKRLAVLSDDKVPSALVEIGYLSSDEDRAYLTENMTTVADVLAHGVDWWACQKQGKEKTNWPEMKA